MLSIANEKCSGCYACVNICPKQCIDMISDDEGFWYPSIDTHLCVDCDLCTNVCPRLCKDSNKQKCETKAFAAVSNLTNVKTQSSSGGIFFHLAKSVIESDGVVFGAALSEDCKSVYHKEITTVEEIKLLQGSKYVQSKIDDVYLSVKKLLKQGRLVLFTGTPCQVEGLLSYLGERHSNLITQDIICHGVPSPKVFGKYIDIMSARYKDLPMNVYFRSKFINWKRTGIHITFKHGADYKMEASEDLYMRGFLFNLFLRPSCYYCTSKGIHHYSDITLADFWGCESVVPELDDDMGVSLILVHTLKGQQMLNIISSEISYKEIPIEDALKKQTTAEKAAEMHHDRAAFFKRFNISPEDALKKYCDHSSIVKIKRLIRKLLKRTT